MWGFEMRKLLYAAVGVSLIASVAGLLLILITPRPHTTVRLWGKEGLAFSGSIKADGRILGVSSHLPAEFVIAGRSVECSFEKAQPDGTFGIRILSEDGRSFQETYTERPTGGVRGQILVSGVAVGH